jgi:hypothetical protein
LAVAVVVAFVVWMVVARRRPDRPSGPSRAEAAYNQHVGRGLNRPADAGAESQYPDVGDASPGAPGPPA